MFVLAVRRPLRALLLLLAAAMSVLPVAARAQGKLEARYEASIAGIPIGKGTWVIDITDTGYTAAASGTTTGLIRAFTGGQGTSAAHGTLHAGAPINSTFASTVATGRKTDEVSLTIANGVVKESRVDPPLETEPERVPLTDEHRKGILDPMTASLLRTPGAEQSAGAGSLPAYGRDLRRAPALRPAARLQAHGPRQGGQGL